jgi:hypothetical protein
MLVVLLLLDWNVHGADDKLVDWRSLRPDMDCNLNSGIKYGTTSFL